MTSVENNGLARAASQGNSSAAIPAVAAANENVTINSGEALSALRVLEISFPRENRQVQRKDGGDTSSRRSVKATLQRSLFNAQSQLKSLRDVLKTQIATKHKFCYLDGSLADEGMLLDTYTTIVGQSDHKEKGAIPIFIRGPAFSVASPKSPEDILSHKPFLVKVIQWQAADGGTVKSSIHSKTLDTSNIDARTLSLSALRALIPAMSAFKNIHKFCSPSGTTVEDENIRFVDYLALDPQACVEAVTGLDGPLKPVPAVKVFFKENSEKNNPPDIPPNIKADLTLKATEAAKADNLIQKERKSMIDADASLGVKVGSGSAPGPSMLTDAQWGYILRNCGVLYGWYIDRRSKQIMPAPKQAFQIRSKVQTIFVQGEKVPDSSNTAPGGSPSATSDNGPTSSADNKVPDNEKDDSTQKREDQAAKLVNQEQSGTTKSSSEGSSKLVTDRKPPNAGDTNAATSSQDDAAESQTSISPPSMNMIRSLVAVPNFRVNDDSKIEVTACEHEFQISMAKNDFNSKSVEASLSGGYAGWEASVSAGFSQSRESTAKSSSTSYSKTLVARYLYPRCDLRFDADDLEPTDEFRIAIDKVRSTLNINDLRKLHADFGHLFCRKVSLGGRLTATKIVSMTESSSEATLKEDFKTSVGISVKTPIGVGGSAKSDTQTTSSTATSQTQINRNESQVFEAVGGDTILANNPAEWAPTVADFRYWRVINRDVLIPVIDILSAMPDYENVKNMFIQAVPVLDSFVTLNDDHSVIARMKVVAPLNGLSSAPRNQVRYYLGHRPAAICNPRFYEVAGQADAFWVQLEFNVATPLFRPASYRAPMLLGYLDNKLQTGSQPNEFGAKYGADFVETQWEIIAPFDKTLAHGTRVILKTRAADIQRAAPHIVVYRNQQGVFLPAMSDNDEYQYWRILKNDSQATEETPIQEGDEVRLCWSFKDQTTGWRDYVNDVFGRRRNLTPAELHDTVLFLKLPWPRFEKASNSNPEPHAMIMAPVGETTPEEYEFNVLALDGKTVKRQMYAVQDVILRIDTVSNKGAGDSGDYMLPETQQSETTKTLDMRLKNGMTISQRVFWL